MKHLVALFTALAAVGLGYYLNLKSPDLRYQLSSPIPMETEPTAPAKVVQQIELANVGKAVAQRVQVKIRKAVTKLTVIKDSHPDTFAEFDSAGATELIYDSLRPAGRVKIAFTSGEPLTEQDVEVRHLEAPGKLALTSQPSFWVRLVPYIALVLVFLWALLSVRTMMKDDFASKSLWDPVAILRRQKPLLLSNGDWTSNLEADCLPPG